MWSWTAEKSVFIFWSIVNGSNAAVVLALTLSSSFFSVVFAPLLLSAFLLFGMALALESRCTQHYEY